MLILKTIPERVQKGFVLVLILLGVLVITGLVGGAFYFGKQKISESQLPAQVVTSQTPSPTSSPTSSLITPPTVLPIPNEIVNWKTYENSDLGLKFKYPASFSYNYLISGDEYNPGRNLIFTSNNTYFDLGISLNAKQGPPDVLPGYSSQQQLVFNGTTWKLYLPDNKVYCEAGICANSTSPQYWVLKYGKSYQMIVEQSVSRPFIEQVLNTFEFQDVKTAEGQACGYLRGNPPLIQCPFGYNCKLTYPGTTRSSGQCVKS